MFQHRLRIERVCENGRKIAQHIERLRRVGKSRSGVRVVDGARENRGVAGGDILNRTRRNSRRGKFFQNGIQQPTTDGLGQNVIDAAQESFLLPVGRIIGRVGNERRLGIAVRRRSMTQMLSTPSKSASSTQAETSP